MAGNIRISPETMRIRAGQYRSAAQDVGQVIHNMDNLLTNLQSEWEGEASQSYANRYYSDLKPAFQRAQELIDEIAVALDKTANTLEDTDAAIAGGFKG